ncbi:YihY/virulence factor BrkB family protein [Mycobacterium sp. 852002-51057_SCH5723018]|uniref:YihY/virulence factor BrkB family protein n=1 Tax=Mycobacterium sp. 852002-51057_SCH5723018 TaxID=1834094 RepID=UPI0007FD8A00|nr:YihY/virulence factor BrkB family protein [Mycobacterium sp. 852002-51057_SCH5723018]OBG19267.1 ribonuclease BN [Mycobacterium sp. 852002-51057_SCH5723018]
MVGWLDRLQRRNRAVGVIIAVIYKYLDDQGGYLAALITYYGFVSLFPLLLLLTTGLGVLLAGRPDLQEQVLHSTLSQFPVIGTQLHQPEGLSGGTVAVVVGIAGALYGGLGVGQAVQNAMDSVWAVPRNNRPDPFRSRLRSLLLLLVLGSAAIAVTVLSAVGQATGALGLFGKIGIALVAVAINALICLVVFRVTTARQLTYRQVWPGAVAAALIWQILQWFGAGYIRHTVKTASATNSVFALVLGLLAFLYLISMTLVLCAEINVVLVERLYPRALLTPFTDDVDLTQADRKTYTKKAKAERVKAFQRVSVRFGEVAPKATSEPTAHAHDRPAD